MCRDAAIEDRGVAIEDRGVANNYKRPKFWRSIVVEYCLPCANSPLSYMYVCIYLFQKLCVCVPDLVLSGRH